MSKFRAFYGAKPLHLLVLLITFAIVAAGVIRWCDPGSDTFDILAWLACCGVTVELVILPLAWLLNRVACRERVYVRIPAVLSGLLLLVFLPLILDPDNDTYSAITGAPPRDYLKRWLLASVIMFASSALVHAARQVRSRPKRPSRVRPNPPGA
jgi:hypothetical protein